jgi:hypothetical protein
VNWGLSFRLCLSSFFTVIICMFWKRMHSTTKYYYHKKYVTSWYYTFERWPRTLLEEARGTGGRMCWGKENLREPKKPNENHSWTRLPKQMVKRKCLSISILFCLPAFEMFTWLPYDSSFLIKHKFQLDLIQVVLITTGITLAYYISQKNKIEFTPHLTFL